MRQDSVQTLSVWQQISSCNSSGMMHLSHVQPIGNSAPPEQSDKKEKKKSITTTTLVKSCLWNEQHSLECGLMCDEREGEYRAREKE